MPIGVRLLAVGGSEYVHTGKPFDGFPDASTAEPMLVTTNYHQAHGVFRSETRSSAGTTSLVAPVLGTSILLTDLILNADRVNAATATVRFNDGTNTVNIFSVDVTDAPANIAIPFRGRFQGWKDAAVELVTTSTVTATATLGYIKLPQGLPYAEWDALR